MFSSIPLAIITNSMRIAMTAILHKYFGARVAEGFFHGFSGLLIFAICIPVLFIEMKILEKLPPVWSESSSEHRLSRFLNSVDSFTYKLWTVKKILLLKY